MTITPLPGIQSLTTVEGRYPGTAAGTEEPVPPTARVPSSSRTSPTRQRQSHHLSPHLPPSHIPSDRFLPTFPMSPAPPARTRPPLPPPPPLLLPQTGPSSTAPSRAPLVCPFPGCGRTLCRRAYLEAHLAVHSGEKSHSCDKCEMVFRFRSNLRRHITTAHGKNGAQRTSYMKGGFRGGKVGGG